MSNRNDLWALLLARKGEWIAREDLNFVGGYDAVRRMRDIRQDIIASGQFRLEERKAEGGVIEYRLIELEPDPASQNARFLYRCAKCGSHPTDYMTTQPSIDPRWRLGTCDICREKNATFRKVTT